MGNPSYDIDDILNEVRKRREENEAEIKARKEPENDKLQQETSGASGTETEESFYAEEAARQSEETVEKKPEYPEQSEKEKSKPDAEKTEQIGDRPFLTADGEGIDLSAVSDYQSDNTSGEKTKRKSEQKWHKTGQGKICIAVIVILLLAIIGAGVYAGVYISRALDQVTDNQKNTANLEEWSGMDVFAENFDPIYEASKSEISSYRDMIKSWYYNGTPASSTHVLNVLLVGEDTRTEEIEEDGTRADSAIIVSINIDTREIVLTSILRDSYAYWELTEGDESTGQFGKINEAMSAGGINCYINCVEHMFKINIDNYVIVNFESFETIVDTLGGVTINMTKAEINEINNHQKRYNYVTIDGEPGELQLNGKQALAYCRIRKIDSDSVRADRQKTVLLQLFKKMQSASSIKTIEVATGLLPYVKTGFSKSEVLAIGKYAISHGWLSFTTNTYTVPANETEDDGTVVTTCKGGTYYGAWVWKVDYPLCAQIVQNKIYGKTNVVLAEKRPKFLNLSDY